MSELIFVSTQELMTKTILSGNCDVDKLRPLILETQLKTIETLLGSELYDKIYNDADNDSLSGLYLELFNDFVVPITRNQTIASYILVSPYSLGNGGMFKRTYNGVENIDYKEVERVSQIYSSTAQMYINRFHKWIVKNPLEEYKTYQDEVNASKNINLNNGWYLGSK